MNVQDKKWVVSLPYERGLQLVVFRKPNCHNSSLLKYNTAAKFQVYRVLLYQIMHKLENISKTSHEFCTS